MILSIIVVSHNQKWQLKRCIDSILAQQLPFEHEIIISDDASSDGTWELAQQYADEHSSIKVFQCDSNTFKLANDSARGCWNRCNGNKHATGKYLAYVDGDDFFVNGTDIYKKSVEILEKNVGCSCCMANNYTLKEGDDLTKATLRHREILQTGEILSSKEYIKNHFREGHCFVYRNNPRVNPVEFYGIFYEDTIITAHHLQFGNIVCLNDAGHIYVQHDDSVWSRLVHTKDHLLYAHALYVPLLIPKWHNCYYTSPRHLSTIVAAIQLALTGHLLKGENLKWISHFDRYIYHTFNRKLIITDYFLLYFLCYYIKVLIKFKIYNRFFSWTLKYLL